MKFTRILFSLILTVLLSVGILSMTASADGNCAYGIGFVTASSLRLRSQPTTDSTILAEAPANECVVVLSQSGDWYQVNYNLQIGYMHKDYISVLTRENAELGYGRITGSGVNMRSGPSTSHSVLAVTQQNAKCYIIGLNEGWYKVIYDGKTGYIFSQYVELTEIPYENQASSNTPQYYRHGKSISSSSATLTVTSSTAAASSVSSFSGSGSDILAEAQKYLGIPYVYGGASPSGFDCSGFVYYVLRQLGFPAYRTPADQYSQGTYVEKSDLQVGDIVFFAGTGASGVSHVGIYAGGGQFIHSPNSRSTVSYSDLTSGYWAQHYYGARRIG